MRGWWLLVFVALVAASCSGDDRSADPGPGPTATSPAATAVTTESITTLRPPVPTDPPLPPAPMIGDLEIPCAPTDPTPIADAIGVTGDSIVIGTGSDRGGIATAGTGTGILEMIETLAELCNAHGGLHGRDIRVVEYDAAGVETVERVRAACSEVVALVGESFLQLVEEVLTALECGLDRYPAGEGLLPGSPVRLHGHLTAAFADPDAARIVLVGPDTPTANASRDAHQAAIGAAGGLLEVVGSIGYPIDRPPDWDRLVGEARATGAGQVHIDGGCEQAVVPFVEVADRAGWAPMIVATAKAYDAACFAVATPDRLLVEVPFLPYEDGDAAPAAAAHAELLDRTAAPRTGVGVLAASAFWRWAIDAAACLGSSDGECSSPLAGSAWTAGGLHVPVVEDGDGSPCAVVVGVEGDAFVRRLPVEAGAYACDAAFTAATPD